jgi:hypothetical protein
MLPVAPYGKEERRKWLESIHQPNQTQQSRIIKIAVGRPAVGRGGGWVGGT